MSYMRKDSTVNRPAYTTATTVTKKTGASGLKHASTETVEHACSHSLFH